MLANNKSCASLEEGNKGIKNRSNYNWKIIISAKDILLNF